MNQDFSPAQQENVYVVGAGFSRGLRYPLMRTLLVEVWERLPAESTEQLTKIIKFHHPGFDPGRSTSFPDIEQLLTEIEVNDQFFSYSRQAQGRFTKEQLRQSRETLLATVRDWFHGLYPQRIPDWVERIVELLRDPRAAIISFNWDLVLDQLLFNGALGAESYGLSELQVTRPLLLKPHGSLNWYEGTQLEPVDGVKKVEIFHDSDKSKCVYAFLPPREVESKTGRVYTPLIIPPTYFKDFTPPVFVRLWQRCTDALSVARRVVFLGYSLPISDIHARFILRCGFHNQTEGRIKNARDRHTATGAAEVVVVDPDQGAAKRIEDAAGRGIKFSWVPRTVQEWVNERAR